MYDVLMYSCGICMPCMYPHLLCNVDVMISTLQKRFQYAGLSLVGPSSSSRIGLHIGRDNAYACLYAFCINARFNLFCSYLLDRSSESNELYM